MPLEITALPASAVANTEISLTINTRPGAICRAQVWYHSGRLSLAPGIRKWQTADSAGNVTWVWTVDDDPGLALATATCWLGGSRVTRSRTFMVL